MEELLNEWGIPQDIIEIFKANQIERNQLIDMNNDILKELIPSVGPRLKMLAKIKEMKEQILTSSASTVTITTDDKSDESEVIPDVSAINNSNGQIFTITEETPVLLYNKDFLTYLKPQYEDFCLKTLLTTTALGKSVLTYYQTFNKLDNTRRNRLCSIVVKHLYNYIIKNRLRQEEYNSLAAKILTVFPSEMIETYYVPPIRKANSPFGKSMMAKGKLVHQVKNIIFRSGDTNKRCKGMTDESVVPQENPVNLNDTHQDDIIWLLHNRDPWETVIEKWRNTYEVRSRLHSHLTITEYIEKWPILFDLRAPVLIKIDFEEKYPDSNIAFWNNWSNFFEKVFSHKKDEIKDVVALEYIKKLQDLSEEDDKFPLQLSVLNYMFPPKGRLRTKAKNHWKFSTIESLEGIIKHVKNTGDIQAEIEETINKALLRKQSIQPFLLVDGTNIHSPNACYVVINHNLRYQFRTVSEAFDVTFKLFHSLNLKYPSESQHIYQLIQTCVYKVHSPYDIIYPDIIHIQNMFK